MNGNFWQSVKQKPFHLKLEQHTLGRKHLVEKLPPSSAHLIPKSLLLEVAVLEVCGRHSMRRFVGLSMNSSVESMPYLPISTTVS